MNVERPVKVWRSLRNLLEVASCKESKLWNHSSGGMAGTLYILPLVSHGIAMCAGRMNGDTRVTKIIDELYCIVARSGCNVGDDPEQSS